MVALYYFVFSLLAPGCPAFLSQFSGAFGGAANRFLGLPRTSL